MAYNVGQCRTQIRKSHASNFCLLGYIFISIGQILHIDPVLIEKCLAHRMPKIMATEMRGF